MKWIQICATIILLLIANIKIAESHAVYGQVGWQKGMLVKAVYDGEEPMSYAAVEIYHQQEKLPFQTGRTDRNGCFLFLPDQPGGWKIVVKDGMGHQLSLSADNTHMTNLMKEENAARMSQRKGNLSRTQGMLMGVSIIFSLFGFFFWLSGRRIRK